MTPRLFGREDSLAHELRDDGLILRELREYAAAQPVRAAVAHMRDEHALLPRPQRRKRSTHALARVAALGAQKDRAVGLQHCLFQHAQIRALLAYRRERPDRQIAGYLAGLVSAHAVGDDKQAVSHQHAILVDLSYAAHVGPEGYIHGYSSD